MVPAKGVSERFKKKNIHPCNGVPLVVHPLRIIKECGFFDSTLISTESEEVIKTCEEYGFSENYRRPEYMSLARSSVWDAVRHAMRYMSKQGLTFDYVAIMHPTSPCIRPQTVKTLCEHFHEHADVCDAMVAVAFTTPFSWCAAAVPDFSRAQRTQTYSVYLKLTNAFFIAKWDKLLEEKNIYKHKWLSFTIEADEAIDIDEELDLHMAEAILQWRDKNEAKEPSARDLRDNKYAHVREIRERLSSHGRRGAHEQM
ncbi:MAG: acylneuraminate cytidylyltransferase family protein [Candidatus Thorarchaeota archaeon]